MRFFQVIWDEPDEVTGNVLHIAEDGLTVDEVDYVIENPVAEDISHSSGRPALFGYTPSGDYIVEIYEEVAADTIYPVTAYEVPEP